VKKNAVTAVVTVADRSAGKVTFAGTTDTRGSLVPLPLPDESANDLPSGTTVKVPLIRLAWGRSGDKGNTSNIGESLSPGEFGNGISC
jgi:hypothetical protein